MRTLFPGRILKMLFVGALIVLAFSGMTTTRLQARADKATYTILAGASLIGDNGAIVDLLGFYPQTVKVHRGDTVTWVFNPIHNVRFVAKPADLLAPQEIDGKQYMLMNPLIGVPNAKDGDTVKDGLNTALLGDPSGPTTFSVVMDAAPGTYTYLCDIHAGMIGNIVIADDSTTIPTSDDVTKEGKQAVTDTLAQSQSTYVKANDSAVAQPKKGSDTLEVSAGFTAGTGSINRFFPSTAIIEEGQTVKWTVPPGLEPHTVNLPLPEDGSIPPALVPVTDSKNNVYLTVGESLLPNAKTGDSYSGQQTGSGLLLPGQSFALKFPKAGVYKFYCAIHPGQIGTLVVMPAASK